MVEDQEIDQVAGKHWSEKLLKKDLTQTTNFSPEVLARLEFLLSGQMSERELTPPNLKEIANYLIEKMTAELEESEENQCE